MRHEWLIFSLVLLGIWSVLYFAKPYFRREMFWVSLFTMPFGFTEPLFVPEYWNPPSLFNLAQTTGFDIESLIFCFAIGGIGSILYETIFKVKHQKMSKKEIQSKRHRFHKLALATPLIIFLPMYLLTRINPIYSASTAMFSGGIATSLCRPDLKRNVFIGGISFALLYFLFFLFINFIFPGFTQYWNLEAISGILLIGVPLEEIMFGFTFGTMWSSIYERIRWFKEK